MANERAFMYRNTGTDASPVWERWFVKTVADAVYTNEDGTENVIQYVDRKFNELTGGNLPETLDTLKEITDYIEGHEDVVAAINAAIANKADKNHTHTAATTAAAGFMSAADKTKLDGIATGANKYIHPDAHPATMVTQDSTHRFITDTERTNWTSYTTFTNDTPVVNAHGGVAAGTTFNKMPIPDVLNKILYPYVAPTVSASVVTPGNGGTYEIGATVNVTKIRATVTKKSSSITKVEIYDGSTAIATKTDGVSGGGTFDFTTDLSVTSNKNYQAKVTDADSKITTANTGTFSFVHPYYTGTIASGTTLTSAVIKALTKKIEAKGNKTYTYNTDNNCMVIAYPSSYGNIKQIIDPNGFNITDTFTLKTVNVTCLNNAEVSYNVYVSAPATVSAFAVKFNY